MILKKWNLALVALMMTAPMSASALGISIVGISSPSGTTTLFGGDTITIDLVVENSAQVDVNGLSIGITGYDTGNDAFATNNHVVLSGGSVADSLFDTFPGNIPGTGLSNIRTAPTEQGGGPPFINPDPLRTQLFDGASLTPFNGDGTVEDGVDGNSIADGDVHFRVQFTAQTGINSNLSNQVVLQIGTGSFGNVAVGPGGVLIDFESTSLTLNVIPEPGTALLMGLGLIGLASRRR